jgi:hypothetical protein
MSYRPICDVWILGRSKTKDPSTGKNYYGAYPSGFLERARPMLVGGDPSASILHVCGGMSKHYNGVKGGITLSGFGKNDITLDIDPECKPDILFDARELHLVERHPYNDMLHRKYTHAMPEKQFGLKAPDAILIDRPYSEEDAKHYRCGPDVLPDLNKLVSDCLRLTDGLVGVIDYQWPSVKDAKEVAAIAVGTGRNARARWFTIWKSKKRERLAA